MFAYMLRNSTSRLMVLKHLSLTLTVEHILLKCCPHVLGKLLPCVHHTCTRVRIDIYIPLLACAYICMDAYTNCALQWKHVILGEKFIRC